MKKIDIYKLPTICGQWLRGQFGLNENVFSPRTKHHEMIIGIKRPQIKVKHKTRTKMRIILMLTFIVTISLTAFSQDNQTENENKYAFSYAYISVEGKIFSKKLKVEVDFGDTPEQIKTGQEYSEILTNKKSYAAVLNYMVENEFELVETLTLDGTSSYQGTGSGGTTGIIFIMKKRK